MNKLGIIKSVDNENNKCQSMGKKVDVNHDNENNK